MSNNYYVCENCNSTNVSFEAEAKWDIDKQQFVIVNVTRDGYEYCNDCEQETEARTVMDEVENA